MRLIFFILLAPHLASADLRELTSSKLSRLGPNRSESVREAIFRESRKRDLDPILLMALIEQESHFNPNSRGAHGELGLMQVRPKTAGWLAKKFSQPHWRKKNALLNPITNIEAGAAYLSVLKREFGEPRIYLAAYNSGATRIRRRLGRKKLPRRYANLVLRNYNQMKRRVI